MELKHLKLHKHQILGQEGAYELLRYLRERSEIPLSEITRHFAKDFGAQRVADVINDLQANWFVEKIGDRIRITEDGSEAYLLLRVINGASLESVIDELSSGMRRRFSLITRDITGAFFEMLSHIPRPKEILICSPWIRLSDNHLKVLSRLARRGVKISVITKPLPSTKSGEISPSWKPQILKTIKWLVENRIETVVHPRLHSKLYIINTDYSSVAIFGSENLTAAGNIELGIKVTDGYIIGKLINYWDDIFSESQIWR